MLLIIATSRPISGVSYRLYRRGLYYDQEGHTASGNPIPLHRYVDQGTDPDTLYISNDPDVNHFGSPPAWL